MAVEIPKQEYTGTIKEITLGKGEKAVTVGGESAYPFYTFEGEMPHRPRIAMEVLDKTPEEWPAALTDVLGDVLSDPAAWAKKCVEEFGAEMIMLSLASTDPNADDTSPEAAVEIVKKVLDAIDVPLIVWGCDNDKKDSDVLRAVSEACEGREVILGPVVEGNYKQIGAGAIGYKHKVVASTPIDINLAKQLNILLGNLGVPDSMIVVDPTTGGLGYGLEYSYSVMERARMAALAQQDEKLQFPMVCYIGRETWKTKEAKVPEEEEPSWGDATKRGILMESITAVSTLLAGADIMVLRHPESVKLVKAYMDAFEV